MPTPPLSDVSIDPSAPNYFRRLSNHSTILKMIQLMREMSPTPSQKKTITINAQAIIAVKMLIRVFINDPLSQLVDECLAQSISRIMIMIPITQATMKSVKARLNSQLNTPTIKRMTDMEYPFRIETHRHCDCTL